MQNPLMWMNACFNEHVKNITKNFVPKYLILNTKVGIKHCSGTYETYSKCYYVQSEKVLFSSLLILL